MISCPRCGDALERGQEYCLTCGTRLAGTLAAERPEPAGGWLPRAGLALAVAALGTAAAIAVESSGRADRLLTAAGGFATVPAAPTLPAPAEAGAGSILDWPAGEDGWTVVLATLPQTEGRRAAIAQARDARRRGLPAVGILDSSRYASLHPGYWVVFSGVYTSEAEAASALPQARRLVGAAATRRIVP